ncbi:cytosolic carboxypeptidase Nna1 isoform X6 [Drosophila willistoni]|uniref:cytosolic carboxypeptidase Nna1 isoform X6 n=1 Tax=Drosophila willistoni TaxID=7260 RepID=UPI001F075FFC|nr:cytosolic carboxypeptidase Nna1 isoform X6 [Drosophila willistoni]
MQRATKDKDNYRDNNRSSNSGSSYNNNNHNNSEAINQQQYQYQHQYHLQHQKTEGFLGSFLSKGLKTNQLVVNTDEKTLRPIARLKEPRDLFALPKDKDNDCSQQAPRWPVECQVIEERITHIPYVPAQPEPLNMPTGNELKPRPVGEENGIVVFSYNPISAVNYEKPKAKKNDDSSDESDYSSDSHIDSTPPSRSTPVRQQAVGKQPPTVSKMINNLDNRSTSVSLDEDNDFEDDYDYDTSGGTNSGEAREKAIIKDLIEAKKKRYAAGGSKCTSKCSSKAESSKDPSSEIDDIWKNNSTEYKPASPRYVLSQFGRKVSKAIIEKMCDSDDKPPNSTGGSGCSANKVPKSKYAVAPIKLPKSNIARLEQAFQRSASTARTMFQNASIDISDDDEDDDSTSTTLDDTDEMDEQSERKDRGRGGAGGGNIEAHPLRLTGGAEKRQCNGSTSVSETDTLVGDESLSRLLATKQDVNAFHSNALPPGIIHRARPHTHEATMAAAAAVARGRNRDIESIYYAISAPSSSNSNALSSTTTSTTASTTNSTYSNISTSTNNNNNYWLGKNEAMHPLECPDTTINNNNSISGINQATTMTTPPSSQSVSSAIPPQSQFSRSAVGGAKFVTNCHPMNPDEYDGLEFESRFESGNLAKAVQITPTYYELYLRPDLYTSRSKQWFYFRVRRTHRKMLYRFSIVNLVKSDSLYNDGMQPVMYSTLGAKEKNEGWRRCGDNICYYRNDDDSSGSNSNANEEDEDNSSYTLTFTIEFEHDDDSVYFAHSYPYTYSDLQDYLMEIQRHPVKSKFCKLRLLCRTLAGNNVYYLTVTAPSSNEESMRRKKSIVVSARVHPSETPASWMMKGLMDFITGDTTVAKRLRHKFIFKLVPMLNPDGVIVGNTRNSLTGKDLNRQYRTVIRETYPSIWYTKAMIRRLIEECGVAMYCDMHAHSRKHNIFIYGCENKRNPEKKLTEQVFPLMLHKNSADRFSFESCKFKIQRSKEGTGRIVVWMLGITNSYTIEASFGGSSLGSRKGTHFNTQDYEHMGRAFCETLLDYCDENPNKVKRLSKLFKQIKKIRKREKREQKALKLQKMADQILNLLKQQDRLRSKIIERLMREGSSADEPLNIPLSDYSSDEGNCSSSSDNEGKHSITASDLEGPCCAPTRAPPSSPEVMHEIRKNRRIRVRSKSSKKRGDLVRTTLDLPTTDPGSDLHFSTDDEEHSPPSGNANYGQVAPLRHTLLQSELQRRYIEEIGDTVVQKPKPAHMPPELIVTTPSKSNSNGTSGKKIDVYKLTPRTAPELEKAHHHSGGVGVSGAQTLTARRTYSWHNLDQEVVRSAKQNNFYETRVPPTASVKAPKVAPPPPRRTVPSNFIPQRHMNSANQADDLQLKLSLKKKIWTGAQGEPDGRPLAWFRSHQSQVQSQVQAHAASAVAQTTSNRSAGGGASAAPPLRTVSGGAAGGGGGGGVMTNGPPPAFIGAPATTATAARKPRKLEQMDLFNACSQKLLQWQQQEDQQQQLPHHQHKKLQQTQQQQQQRLNGGTNVKLDEQLRYKPLPTAAGGHKKSSSVSANKQMPLTSGPPPPQPAQPSHHHHQHHHHHLDKGKRKSNSLIKIAETTQLVTRFARGNRGSAPGGSSNQQQQQQQQRLLYKTPTGTVGGMTAGGGGRMHSAGAGMQPAIGRGGGGGGGLPNKFKTGGLVITAVQQPRNLPGGSRRMRNAAAGIGGGGAGGGIGTTTTTTTLLQYQRSSHSVQMHKSSTGISLDTVNLVRKVKTKLKKRKSRTLTK